MFVKPVSGGTVRDPHTREILPSEGKEVPSDNLFWVERVKQGDVIVVQQPTSEI